MRKVRVSLFHGSWFPVGYAEWVENVVDSSRFDRINANRFSCCQFVMPEVDLREATLCESSWDVKVRIESNRKVPQTNRLSLDVLDMDGYGNGSDMSCREMAITLPELHWPGHQKAKEDQAGYKKPGGVKRAERERRWEGSHGERQQHLWKTRMGGERFWMVFNRCPVGHDEAWEETSSCITCEPRVRKADLFLLFA